MTNWVMEYLAGKLFVEVIVPSFAVVRHKIMFFILFGWMFHVKDADGRLVAELFVEEMWKLIEEENTPAYHEPVEEPRWK